MGKVYKFPVNQDKTASNIGAAFFVALGAVLVLIHVLGIAQGFPIYFGVLPLTVGILMFGVKRDVTIDTATGTVKSIKGFYFLTSTEMFIKRDFEEIYIRRSYGEKGTGSLSSNRTTFYNLILNGRGLITVESFIDRAVALHWQKILAEALQLKFGEERSEDGTVDKSVSLQNYNVAE
ncbi:MAG: hypothetical protein RIB47_06550 [Cyclobacteriaceae bacterium]